MKSNILLKYNFQLFLITVLCLFNYWNFSNPSMKPFYENKVCTVIKKEIVDQLDPSLYCKEGYVKIVDNLQTFAEYAPGSIIQHSEKTDKQVPDMPNTWLISIFLSFILTGLVCIFYSIFIWD